MASLPFKEIWCVDTEYEVAPGANPMPLCLCAHEYHSGRELRIWRDELLSLKRAPFNTGSDAIVIAYAASAELSCFLELYWPLPINVLDLFAEHRVETNGMEPICGNGLLGALAIRGLAHINAGAKQEMQKAIGDGSWRQRYSPAEILDYCMVDAAALAALMPIMSIDLPRALLRGRYGAAVARMERAGVPIDVPLYTRVVENWGELKRDLVRDVDQHFGIYEDMHFRFARFERCLVTRRIQNWPRTESGRLATDDDTFAEQVARYPEWPELQTLRELRATLDRMRVIGLEIGPDDRNRCSLMPFQPITGRNLPSNGKFIFGPARWIRGFIRPPEGYGLAYLDFASEEIAIAAALSGDQILAEHYATGDPYLRFAIGAGLAPRDATKDTHRAVRDACKSLFLGIGYGMQAPSLAQKAGITRAEAAELIRLHDETYRAFARWREKVVDQALLSGQMHTAFGWRRRGCEGAPRTELMNWPIQSAGADLMRVVCIAATEVGIEVACPVHDAFLIVSPLDRLAQDLERMREIMAQASEVVTGGLRIRVDAKIVRAGRYMDERGSAMWDRVMELLRRRDERAAA
jgi:DNA polymerase I